jgi:hypothetical protein
VPRCWWQRPQPLLVKGTQTDITGQSHSWEDNGSSPNSRDSPASTQPNVHYRIHNSPPPVPVVRQTNLTHTLQPIPLTYFNIIVRSTPMSSTWPLPTTLSNQNVIRISYRSHACYTPRPSHTPWFSRPHDTWNSSLRSCLQAPVTSSPLRSKYSPRHLVLNALSLRSPLSMTDQISRPYKTEVTYSFVHLIVTFKR